MIVRAMLPAAAAAILVAASVAVGNDLQRGKDRVEVPATGPGLWVHGLFQSNMVVQRDRPIRVRGWADPGETVTVSFGDHARSATAAADRAWTVELPSCPACADPRTLTIRGETRCIELENVLVGDVWLLGGQSNMEFELAKVDGGQLEVVSANFANIRLLTVPHLHGPVPGESFPRQQQWSDWSSRHFRQGYWDVCSPRTVTEMSAIGYVFGRRIHMATEIPIGLVDVSRGGTSLETWTPIDVLQAVDTPEVETLLAEWDRKVAEYDPAQDLARRISRHNDRMARLQAEGKPVPADQSPPTDLQPGPAQDVNRPGSCYAGMIAPLAGFPIKGAIWHQGYNNALQPNGHVMYAQVFPRMIAAWRRAFDDPHMPFGIITQETEGEPQTLDDFLPRMVDEGVYIREVQYRTFLDLRKAGDGNVGYASSFDQHRAWYHPQIKIPVGERIACWALATQYGKNLRWLPPQVEHVDAGDGRLVVRFDSAVGPFHDGPIRGFAIAGRDGRFQPAEARWLDRNEGRGGKPDHDRTAVVLTSPLVPEPVSYRYAWARNPLENLKSADHTDLPVDTQRNDAWSLADAYEIHTGKRTKTPGVLDRGERGELVKALQAEDLKRRLAEARALLDAP